MQVKCKKLLLERANKGLTLNKLSKLSGVGRSTISRIERGAAIPRPYTLGKIANALGKTIEDFIEK